MEPVDVVIVGAGHNGLVAATLLARAGRSVRVLERSERPGGAAVSEHVFPGVEARLSRYSYLVSLFPTSLRDQLGLGVELRPRHGLEDCSPELARWRERLAAAAQRLAPTLTEPLLSREAFRARLADDQLWEDVFERPLAVALERDIPSDEERGVVLTDALIGTFAAAEDPELRQNRCFLYHVIGDGAGRWDVPVGGMGQLTNRLVDLALDAGVEIRTGSAAIGLESDGRTAEILCIDASRHRCRHVLWGAAPAPLAGMLDWELGPPPEGSQLKVNMLLRQLPRLRGTELPPERAFAGTFHVNESYAQLQTAYEEAAVGFVPTLPPCDVYCHTLTDPSILGSELRAAGAQALTVFVLHMPARLFGGEHDIAKRAAVEAAIRSLDSVLLDPIEECLWTDGEGTPCLEALTPIEIESELGMPGGHIFHRDLQWPFAESDEEIGCWGVETEIPNLWLCGAGARRGGGVSGIPGHNAARAVLDADGRLVAPPI
ncbi:MAG TPA: NAD(P)/FAD-dependent oxidoreductase [Solirubrobacteraceae bacterium]|nr:NAD(P)/FAD-dependent oxidoreductase [Solirubrobacteraceae bacterium]